MTRGIYMRLKYRIYDFLDNQDVDDYLSAIQMVARSFNISLDEAESHIRKWYSSDEWIYGTFYKTMKTIANMYRKDLNTYSTSREFWSEVISELDFKSVELLLLLPEDIWLGGLKKALLQRKSEFFNVA